MRYVLGLDLGTNSIGWAILSLDGSNQPTGIVDLGSRIFHDGRDPKSGESKAVQRRLARQARRGRDRTLQRKKKLLRILTKEGFFPSDLQKREQLKALDVYRLRVEALNQKIEPYQLGRILYHLAQRRGFKSGRKYLRNEDQKQENQKLIPKLEDLEKRIKESKSRTFGEYLFHLEGAKRNKANLEESLHPTRDMMKKECEQIITKQKLHHKNLTKTLIDKIENIIFYQRPLRSVEELVGPCEMYPDTEKRGANYLPSTQEFKLLQTIGQLKLIQDGSKVDLNKEQKQMIYKELVSVKKKSFTDLRIKLGLDSDIEFNLEDSKRKYLNGNAINAKFKGNNYFGKEWLNLPLKEKDQILLDIAKSESQEQLKEHAKTWRLQPKGDKIFEDDLLGQLPKGYGRFSQKATHQLCKTFVQRGFCRYDEAMENLGYKLGDHKFKSKVKDKLPYYGEILKRYAIPRPSCLQKDEQDQIGRISNPTVHIVLNQLRLVVNALIDRYSKPEKIVLELGRNLKMNKKQKTEYERQQKKNQQANENADQELDNLGLLTNRENRIRYKLWKEMCECMDGQAQCPYTGKMISISKAFSREFEIEHILPFSKTLDDSFANKILSDANANQEKLNKSPFEAFSSDEKKLRDMLARVKKFPPNKRWRFYKDAMERFKNENEWLSRQLNDMRYMSRVAKEYVKCICHDVSVSKGIYTGKVRYGLGLNSILQQSTNNEQKNRDDYRHHAIDAVVIAFCSQSFLQRLLRNAKENNRYDFNRLEIQEPWEGFRNDLAEKIKKVNVSVREDHSVQGAFFEETAYGLLENEIPDKTGGNPYNVIIRKSVEKITKKTVSSIKNDQLRRIAEDIAKKLKDEKNEKIFSEKMKETFDGMGIYKIKVYDKQSSIIPIEHPQSARKFKKGYISGENHHLSIWEDPKNREWKVFGINLFEANKYKTDKELTNFLRKRKERRLHPASRRVMKIHKKDTVSATNRSGKRCLWIVKSLKPTSKQIVLNEINIINDTEPLRLSFSKFKEHGLEKVRPNVLGYRLND